MNSDTRPKPAEADAHPVARGPAPAMALHALLAHINPLLVAALLAIVMLGWQWYDSNTRIGALQQELARRLAEVDVRGKDSTSVAEQAREAVREFQTKLAALEARLAESQNQQVALEALYQELARNHDEWALAEIEQTLLLASQQL